MFKHDLSPVDYAKRRQKFYSRIKGGLCVLPAPHEKVRNDDVNYLFRQESNFYYFTGFPETSSIAMFAPENEKPFQMFVHPKDKTRELWEGKLLGVEGAKSQLGADAAFASIPGDAFDEAFILALMEADRLYYTLGADADFDARIFVLMKKAARRLGRTGRPQWPILDPDEEIGELRLIKTKEEIARLERAAHVSAEAHTHAMKISKPGMFEYEVEAALYHSFKLGGCERVGYESIVASGANACCLHYRENNRKMKDRDLLLIDAGGEFEYYTADITRTFPISGTFTPEQRDIYQAVLNVQKDCIKLARPGKSVKEIHDAATEGLIEELRRLKVLKGTTKQILAKNEHKKYYPHGTGHWLGMDVHDVGRYYTERYSTPRKFQPGHVFTIEPGLYFQTYDSGPAKYKGIGVRIEDDILITEKGCQVLTSGAPKEIEEIEAICSSS